VLHAYNASKRCCGTSYRTSASPSDVCCGTSFFSRQADHQCCGGSYAQMTSGQVCCDGVVGQGTECCGTTAFTNTNDQPLICCGGTLHARNQTDAGQQCCGGDLVSGSMECCGREESGIAYLRSTFMECCGTGYVSSSSSLCCTAASGEAVSYDYPSPGAKIRAGDECCGSTRVLSGTGCCNEMPFDTVLGVCSNSGASQACPAGAVVEGSVCDVTTTSSVAAQCGTCDYNPLTSSCFVHRVTRPAMPYTCAAGTLPTTTINATALTATVSGLAPYSQYRFTVAARNSGGSTTSVPTRRIWTMEDAPAGLLSPVVVAVNASAVNITWSPPSQPNGVVREYRLVRFVGTTRSELLRTDAVSHLVVLLTAGPYAPISVAVEACTSAGCTTGPTVVGYSSPGLQLSPLFAVFDRIVRARRRLTHTRT
jgi:usherin